MSENKNESPQGEAGKKAKYQFLTPIERSRPLIFNLVTPGHANFRRFEARFSTKKTVRRFLALIAASLIGTYLVASYINGIYQTKVSEAIAAERQYQSQNGDSKINALISDLQSMKPSSNASVLTDKQFVSRVNQISKALIEGNESALYQIPGVVVNGIGTDISDQQILITPSFEVIPDPENPESKIAGNKIGYTISGFMEHDEVIELPDGTTKTNRVTGHKVVALRLSDGRIYELSSTHHDDEGEFRRVVGDVELFDNFADIERLQTFGFGLVDADLTRLIDGQIIEKGNKIIRTISDGLAPPETINNDMAMILQYMSENNGDIFPKFEHRIVNLSTFNSEGFGDSVKENYSVAKMIKLSVGGDGKYLLLASAKVKQENGRDLVTPIAGLIEKKADGYSYTNIDFGSDKRSKTEWVILDKFPTVKPDQIQRELIELGNLNYLKINNK